MEEIGIAWKVTAAERLTTALIHMLLQLRRDLKEV